MASLSENTAADFLRCEVERRMEQNHGYSLRSFALQLGVSHSYLSLILQNKRRIPYSRAMSFAQHLGWDASKSENFLKAAQSEYSPSPKKPRKPREVASFQLEMDRFRVVSDWYHLAILDLTHIESFRSEVPWVAKKLGITQKETKAAVSRLFRLGLLESTDSGWKKTNQQISVSPRNPEAAVRRFHRQMISKAANALDSGESKDYQARDITGTMIPINPSRLPEAKRRIARFRKRLMDFLSEGECADLYQLNVQLFPLAKGEEK